MSKKILTDLDFNQNEAQNLVVQNLGSAPASPSEGQIWYNTVDKYLYFFDGIESKVVGYLPIATATSLGGVKIGSNINIDNLGTISISDSSSSSKGVIRIATAEEALDGSLENVAITPKQLADSIKGIGGSLSSISATAPITYDKTNHVISANIDNVVGTNSDYLVTSGAVKTYVDSSIIGGIRYVGDWDCTDQIDYSSITLPVKKGYLYYVSGTGPVTIDNIEWNEGDYLLVNEDVEADGTLTNVKKIDNTESSDIVRLTASQTITNKTIDATNNTISNLDTTNLKSDVLQTTIRDADDASDASLVTEKAVRTAIDAKSNKLVVSNPELISSGGICTWNISNTLSDDCIVSIKEISTGLEVLCDVTFRSGEIVIKINSVDTIAADTYKAIIIG